jgi:acyl-CoA dehydrogenase
MTETVRMLGDSVDTFLQRNAGLGEEAFLRAFDESGFALVLASEAAGGLGAGFAEAAAVARIWGRHAAPLPIVEILLSGAIGDGGITIAPAPARNGRVDAARVPGARRCLVPGAAGTDWRLMALDGATVWRTLADEDMLCLDASVPQAAPGFPLPAPSELVRQGAVLTTARILGAMERILDLVTEHVKTRSQFGRPISRFQLVQEMVADAGSEVDATRAVLAHAVDLLDRDRADDIVWRAANAHQIFGAIGFTQEHELHTLTRRLWSWRDLWTTQSEAEAALGAQACAAGAEGLWPLIADAHAPQTDGGSKPWD